MKRAIEENHEVMNCMFDKLKEHDEAINNMESIKEKISKNKYKIWIIAFECIVWAGREVGLFIIISYGTGLYGDLIIKLTGIAQVAVSMIGAYIFGNKTELDDKVGLIQTLVIKNELQHYIIRDKKLYDPGYMDPNNK